MVRLRSVKVVFPSGVITGRPEYLLVAGGRVVAMCARLLSSPLWGVRASENARWE